jgi:hypothetical protein
MTQTLAIATPQTTEPSHDQCGYAVVQVDFLASSKLQCTAHEDTTITGINGVQVTFKKGEKFTLLRSEIRGDNMFFVVPRITPARGRSLTASIEARDAEARRLVAPLNGNRPFQIMR